MLWVQLQARLPKKHPGIYIQDYNVFQISLVCLVQTELHYVVLWCDDTAVITISVCSCCSEQTLVLQTTGEKKA